MFLFLQETWLPNHESKILSEDFGDYSFHTSSSDSFTPPEDLILQSGPTWHGTALGWKKSLEKFVNKLPVISERFCGVKYEDTDSKVDILAYTVYLPTSGQDDEFLEILAILSSDISQHNTNDSVVIIGTDSNVSNKSSRRRYNAMKQFLQSFSLTTILKDDKPTFHHNNQTSESQVDHIYTFIPDNSNVKIRIKDHLCLKEESANISSHDVIVGEIELPITSENTQENDFSSSYKPFIVKKPNWNPDKKPDYEQKTRDALEELSNNYTEAEFIPELCEMFSKALVISAEKVYETSNPNFKSRKKKLPYFSEEYKLAHKNHKMVFVEWRKAGRPSDPNHPAKAAVLISRRNLQYIARNETTSKSLELHNSLMYTHSTDINKVSAQLRKARGDTHNRSEIPFIETLAGKYSGSNVLEGFAANTEILCDEALTDDKNYDNEFYKMIIKDNMIIFEITSEEKIEIPEMNLSDLKRILFKKLKLNKACDIFKLTVEHLRNAGDESLALILNLLNNVIKNIKVLSSPQLNTSVASVVHKGKGKPLFLHKSHRLVRVTPLFGRIIDEYMRPDLINIVQPVQNHNQYGFTETVSYLMGALQRHEVEKYCIDMKRTYFGCSLDGDSAFEVVNRNIQTRELYCAGERGQYWQASHYSYQNSQTNIKMNGQLSRNISETLGVKQGRNKSSDHYKLYVAPLLDTLDTAKLGVWIGNINVGVSGVADDIYLMTDSQTKLQAQLDIATHYGKLYRIQYGASKTKVTIVGSEIDMTYFHDVSPWKMGDEVIETVENNEHLGQIISGVSEESKNVDLKLTKARKCLFGLLGAGFAYKCLLSPVLKLHLYRTYTCPILRSGLSTFVLRSSHIEPLALFQRKTLKSILKLSNSAPTPAVHFLTGELPIEGKIHLDIFSLFYSVWRNPNTKIYEVVNYILRNSSENSRTWIIHLKHLCEKYGLEDPISCLNKDPPPKSVYKEAVKTKVSAYYEKVLRQSAAENSVMTYLNVSTIGLRGRHHPALSNLITTREVQLSRPHIKFLAGNFLTYKIKADRSGGSSRCRICLSGSDETVSHIIASCQSLSVERTRILSEFRNLCRLTKNQINFENILKNEETLTQFILDPTSLNLSERLSSKDPLVKDFFKLSRDFCYKIDKNRLGLLKQLETDQSM